LGAKRTSRGCVRSGSRCPRRYSITRPVFFDGWQFHCNVEAIGASIARLGYIVEKIGTTERILPHAVAQKFEMSSSGVLVAASEGSSRPVPVIVTSAGLARVEQFELRVT
jgi:hypothetical protein